MVWSFYCLFGVAVILAGPAIAFFSSPPVPGEPVLVVGHDSAQREWIVEQAGGRLVGPEDATWGSLAVSKESEFVKELHASGAWIVIDGRAAARLCGVEI